MIVPWPFISRGTEWLVPIVPGLVRLIVVPWKSVDRELVVAGLADEVLVGGPERREVHRLGGLDRGHQQLAGAVGLRQVDGEAEVDVGGGDEVGLAVDDVEAVVHLRHRLERLDQRVADEVRERHLAAAGAGEVVVDDDPVVPEQLDRHRADAGGRRHGEADVHVLHGAGRRAAQHGERRLVGGLGLAAGSGSGLGFGHRAGAARGLRRPALSARGRRLRRPASRRGPSARLGSASSGLRRRASRRPSRRASRGGFAGGCSAVCGGRVPPPLCRSRRCSPARGP